MCLLYGLWEWDAIQAGQSEWAHIMEMGSQETLLSDQENRVAL